MGEKLLKAILRLYALLAGSDGLSDHEIDRIRHFLNPHVAGHNLPRYIEKLEVWAKEALENHDRENWLESQLEEIARTINGELRIAQKVYLFLELLDLTDSDGTVSEQESLVLEKLPGLIHLAGDDVALLRSFASGTTASDFSDPAFVLLTGPDAVLPDTAKSLPVNRFEGLGVVLKLPGIDGYYVRVLRNNETYLNGQWMQPGVSRMWAPGSTLRQEKADPVFFNTVQEYFFAPEEKIPIAFEAANLEFRFRDGRIAIQKTSLSEKGGRLVAIMGASGCGKSTLFSVLNGNEQPTAGTVTINGLDVHRQPAKLEGVIGYIPQDDLLNERLTVFQNLYFAARFSFGQMPEEEIVALCDKTLHSLNLSDVRNKEVGSPAKKTISGGQRKRLNIGLELIRQPAVLFVDEPTSGLSSSDSLRTMELLKNLSLNGKLVFVIIHQPSPAIFQMFDRLLVMDKGGYTIYYGNPLEAIPHFRKESNLPPVQSPEELANSAEIFDLVEASLVDETGNLVEVRKFTPQDWARIFRGSTGVTEPGLQTNPLPARISKPGFFRQVGLFFRRDVLAKLHDRQYLFINLLEAPFLALLLALVVRFAPADEWFVRQYRFSLNENIPAYFFMSVIVALFMGLSVSAEEIIRDRLLLKREKFLHLSRDGYLLAKTGLMFLLSAFHTLAFVAISDFVLQVENMGIEFWMVLFSTSCSANLLGLVLSDSFKNAVVVYILIPLLLIPQLILGGIVVPYDRLNPMFGNPDRVPLVGDLMISRWAYEALMVSQFRNNPYQDLVFESEVRKSDAHYQRTYFLQEISDRHRFLEGVKHPDSLLNPANQIRMQILRRELVKLGNRFAIPESNWNYLHSLPLPAEQSAKTHRMLEQFRKAFNRLYLKEEKLQDRLIRLQGKEFAGNKAETENLRVNEILQNNLDFDSKFAVSREGIFRKVKPVFRLPEPKNSFDFRAHFYSPKKHLGGLYFPTESFNIWVIWLFTLAAGITLRFRLLVRAAFVAERLAARLSGLYRHFVSARRK
jgi:ABC-type multidrug transport system ATPase subunit